MGKSHAFIDSLFGLTNVYPFRQARNCRCIYSSGFIIHRRMIKLYFMT